MKTKSTLITLTALAAGLSLAVAQNDGEAGKPKRPDGPPPGGAKGPGRPGGPGGQGGPGGFLMQLDTDKDGKVTQAEAGERWERLSPLDKNQDGAISREEFPQMGRGGPGGPGGGQFFEKGDKNGDGKLSQDEVPADLWERFAKADKDGDGAVNREELAALFRAGGGRPGGPGGPGNPDGPGGPGRGQFFEMADKNKDGKITQEEAGERWERLSQLDKNGDGGISREELPAMPAGGPGRGGPEGRPGGGGAGGGAAAMFAQSDKNGDGKLSQDEVSAEMWARLSKADRNADGLVSQEELKASYEDRPGGEGANRPKGAAKAGE